MSNLEILDKWEEILGNLVNERNHPITRAELMQAGDVTFYTGWILQSGSGNYSDKTGDVLTIIFEEDGAIINESNTKIKRLAV